MRPDTDEDVLQVRVRAEFRELPGLKLTPAQAARLFSLDRARCERVMGALVDDGVLALEGGNYVCREGRRRGA
jgi:hypothetical protein